MSDPTVASGRTRADLCPGGLRLHQADDGLLARIRVPGGRLTLESWLGIAEAAQAFADGNIDLTARGNVQLRGITDDAAPGLERALSIAGLLPSVTHERARNVVASAMSGLDERGLADVGPIVASLDSALCADPRLADLSGRFLFAIDDGRGDMALASDLSAIAIGTDEFLILADKSEVLFYASGDQVPHALIAAARAFLDLRDEQGTGAWRVRELAGGARDLAARLGDGVEAAKAPVSPTTAETPVGPLTHSDGSVTWVAAAPLGRLNAGQIEAVNAVGAAGDGTIRITPWRSVVIPHVRSTVSTSKQLADAGLVTDPASAWMGVTACAGMRACGHAQEDVRADATSAVARRLVRTSELIHWSGCSRRCGHPADGAIEIVASHNGYELLAQGSTTALELTATEAIAAVAEFA